MTDLEISKALAFAIGWKKTNLHIMFDAYLGERVDLYAFVGTQWQVFDYRDPYVIFPIAEKFDCFPMVEYDHDGRPKFWVVYSLEGSDKWSANTPQKAIALAVIQGVNK